MMSMIFIYPENTANAAREALHVFGQDIVPVLLPYMILARLLVSKTKNAGRVSFWLLTPLSWLGGSPTGASIIQSFSSSQTLSPNTLLSLCALTGTISPVFLLNTVGTWFHDEVMTTLLVVSHYIGAALSSALVYMSLSRMDTAIDPINTSSSQEEESIIQVCAISVLGIGGCLVFFGVLSEIISSLIFTSGGILSAFLHALLEISGGLKELSEYRSEMQMTSGILSSFACGFSGLSILSQNTMFLRPFRVTTLQLVIIGFIRAIVCASVMAFLMLLYSR